MWGRGGSAIDPLVPSEPHLTVASARPLRRNRGPKLCHHVDQHLVQTGAPLVQRRRHLLLDQATTAGLQVDSSRFGHGPSSSVQHLFDRAAL
jgi:hypothetical protein